MEQIKVNSLKAWVLAARPKTLTGAAVPVLIGGALAWSDAILYIGFPFSFVAFALCLLFAWVMQIDANFVNDFFDYAQGIDNPITRLGPKRACAEGWVTVGAMKSAIALTTIAACIVGLPLVLYGGLEMLLIGALCVVCCFLYTLWGSQHGMGDLLVLLFFGFIPVTITYYVQLHTITAEVVVASLACGLVVDTLLMVNNFRDRDTDRASGKTTLVVIIGEKASLWLYLLLGVVACLMGLVFLLNHRPLAFILPLLYLPFHITTWLSIRRINEGTELNKCLGKTSRNIFIYGVLLTIGLMF